MQTFLLYMIKSSTILIVLLTYYQFFLKRQTFFNLNRIFLLGVLVLSALLPFISIEIDVYKRQVSPLYLGTHIPEIYKDRIDNNLPDIRRIFGEGIFVFYLLYILGALCLVLLGPWALELFHSKTQLLPPGPLLLMLFCLLYTSNQQHYMQV